LTSTQTIKVSMTGAQIKSLCTNPTVNNRETIRLASGLGGATTSDVQLLVSMYAVNKVDPNNYVNFTTTTDSSYNNQMFWGAGNTYSNSTGPCFINDGNLDVDFWLIDPSKKISQLNDNAAFDLYLCLGISSNAPSSCPEKSMAPKVGKIVSGTTAKQDAFPVFKSATVASGVATFHLTNDGLSTGTALFPNGPEKNSVQAQFNDSGNIYTPSFVWSNSDKTVTVTVNKLNLLALGLQAGNGATCFLTVWGN